MRKQTHFLGRVNANAAGGSKGFIFQYKDSAITLQASLLGGKERRTIKGRVAPGRENR